jgi:hypothetical protein
VRAPHTRRHEIFNMALRLALLLLASASASSVPPVVWTDALALSVGGRPFPSNPGNLTYIRLPPSAAASVPQYVWEWAQTSSGMFVAFATDASSISLNYTLRNGNWSLFPNFPPNGFSGCDLYRFDDATSAWRYAATTFSGLEAVDSYGPGVVLEAPLYTNASGWPKGPYLPNPTLTSTFRYRLHLPSYNGVVSVSIGVPQGATIAPD